MASFPTTFKLVRHGKDVTSVATDVLIVTVFQKPIAGKSAKVTPSKKKAAREPDDNSVSIDWTDTVKALDKAMGGHLNSTLEAEKFIADCGKRRLFFTRPSDGIQARWVVVLGLGLPEKLDFKKLTQAFHSALKDTFGYQNVHHAALLFPQEAPQVSFSQMAQSAVFAAVQSTYKTQEADPKKIPALKQVSLVLAKGQTVSTADIEAAQMMAFAESLTKDLANKPANLKKAETLAEAARELSAIPGVTVDILADLKKIQKEMPAFWAVGQAAAEVDPPRFIKISYTPSGKGKIKKKIALVGKGVIFDTGGVQVKTGDYMNDMKFDMTGAATVIGVIKAAAELKLKGIAVNAYIAATPNLIGERAYLPDSILDSASGKKIEIRHTDAEGRVTLADAVYKATLDKPDEMITIATLTGAAGIAVGHCTALMGTHDDLLNRIEQSAKAVGEPIQKLEMWEEDFDNIKSDRDGADLRNTSKGKGRGHLTAGAFVVSFAGDIPVAHMDIAGGDAKDGNATGIAVKGLIQYLRNEAS